MIKEFDFEELKNQHAKRKVMWDELHGIIQQEGSFILNNGTVFQKEDMTTFFTEGKELLKKHYEEIAQYKDIPLFYDVEKYLALEKAEAIVCYAARDDKGLLIGYALYFIHHHIHYKTSKQATQDVLFVDPTKRGFGMKFIKWCDGELTKLGVQVVYHHVKLKHDFGAGLVRQGYEAIETIYGKRLDK